MLQLNLIKEFQKPNKVTSLKQIIKFIIPKLFSTTQSEQVINKKAKLKLIMIVVSVKNKFGKAWTVLLYLKFIKGRIPSNIQKNEIPSTKIKLLCRVGIFSKYNKIDSIF